MFFLPWLNSLLAESQVKLRIRKIEEEKGSIGWYTTVLFGTYSHEEYWLHLLPNIWCYMKGTEQCPVREDNLCAEKRTAQVGTICHSASDTEIADYGPLLSSTHVGDNSMNSRLNYSCQHLTLRVHYMAFSALPLSFLPNSGNWSFFGCFRVTQKS